MAVIKVQNLRKSYLPTHPSPKFSVDDISFEVAPGEILGLLGRNGAGKTTTINMILGVLEPTSGSIEIEGLDLAHHRSEALARTNFAAVYAPMPGNLTVYQNLKIFGMIYDVRNLAERIEEVLIQFDLVRFRKTKNGVLSSGEQTRVSLAKAMLNKPRLLLLDEPTASIDPSTAQILREKIRECVHEDPAQPRGVLWTSHNMYEVEEVCHRVLFLSEGKIVLEGNPKTLPEQNGKKTLEDLFISLVRQPDEQGRQ